MQIRSITQPDDDWTNSCNTTTGQNTDIVLNIQNLVAFWTFQEEEGNPRLSVGTKKQYPLREQAGNVARVSPKDGAPFGLYAAHLKEGQWFLLPRDELGSLNICGKDAQVTVIAWIKRHRTQRNRCEAVAGVWDEPRNKRQYCLFLNLKVNKNHPDKRIKDKIAGHISDVGAPTPGFRWCYDVAQSKSSVPYDEWICVGFTYDGEEIRAYYNGDFEAHDGYNPFHFPNGIYDGGPDGSGFKVGVSDDLHGEECNWFAGIIGGVAVFSRALNAEEIKHLAQPPLTRKEHQDG
jgi:hypothetical protein